MPEYSFPCGSGLYPSKPNLFCAANLLVSGNPFAVVRVEHQERANLCTTFGIASESSCRLFSTLLNVHMNMLGFRL